MSSLTLSKMVGWMKKPLLAEPLAAGQAVCALLLAQARRSAGSCRTVLVDLRALLGRRVERVAELAAPCCLRRELVEHLVVDLVLDEQPAAGAAALPLLK